MEGIILKESVGIIQKKHIADLFFADQLLYVSIIITWVHHNDFTVIGSQKRYEAVGVGIFNQEQPSFICGFCAYIHERIIASQKDGIFILFVQFAADIEGSRFLLLLHIMYHQFFRLLGQIDGDGILLTVIAAPACQSTLDVYKRQAYCC